MALILFGTSASGQVYRSGTTGGLASSLVTADATSVNVHNNPAAAYMLRIPNNRFTAAIAGSNVIWGIHNGNSLTMRVRRVVVQAGFDGAAAATTSEFQLSRFSAASGTNFTGGAAIGAVKRATSMNVSTFAAASFNYGAALGVAGITFDADQFLSWGVQRQVSANVALEMRSADPQYESIITLAPNEGLCIRCGVATVIGDSIGGMVEWTEV